MRRSNICAGRLRQWLCVKHKERAGGKHAVSPESLASEVWFGSPYCADREFSVDDGVNLFSRELDSLTAPVQFDKRGCGNVAW